MFFHGKIQTAADLYLVSLNDLCMKILTSVISTSTEKILFCLTNYVNHTHSIFWTTCKNKKKKKRKENMAVNYLKIKGDGSLEIVLFNKFTC